MSIIKESFYILTFFTMIGVLFYTFATTDHTKVRKGIECTVSHQCN